MRTVERATTIGHAALLATFLAAVLTACLSGPQDGSAVQASPTTPTASDPRGSTDPSRVSPRAEGPEDAIARTVRLDVRTTPAAGTTIAWAELGTGRPLVLLNGTGSPMAEWDPALLGAFAAGRRVIVVDYPGLGDSGPPPARITFRRMADWVAAWIRAAGLGQPDVLGWSMGSFVGQQLAVHHPESVRRLVLAGANPGGRWASLGPPWVQREDSDPDATDRAYLRTNYPLIRCAQRRGRAFLRRLDAAIGSGRYPEPRVPARTYDAMVAAEDPWLRSSRNGRALRSLTVPTLVVVGTRDVVTPPANSRALVRLIPGASLRLFAASGHSFLFQEPELVAADVGRFLDTASPPRRRSRASTACD